MIVQESVLPNSAAEANAVAAKPIRICHVSLTLCTGGLERLLVDFARMHNRRRYEMEFMVFREIGAFANQIHDAGCPVHQLTERGRMRGVIELAQFLRKHEFDVVHTHNTHPHIYGTLAARLAGVPVVINTRHGQRVERNWKSRWPYRFAAMLADRMIAVSDDAARMSVREAGVPEKKVARIWNGIDVEQFAWRGPVSEPVGIAVARLSPEKDIPTLLHAVHAAVERVPEFRLIIVGDGPERRRIESLRAELELETNVQILGERGDVPQWLARAGFFISSSFSEGISLTLLEAMAVGLPVIATDVGGNPEIVENGVCGEVVPSGDADAMADAIIGFCQKRETWVDMGQRGRQRVKEHFEIGRMIDEYESLYDELLTHSPRRSNVAVG